MENSKESMQRETQKRLVLIADDEEINREILKMYLQDQYRLLFAENGQEALDRIAENREILSLILLDLMMPVMNGTEVLKRLKEDPQLRSIPVIVITSDQKAEVECLNLGAVDFIPKPYPQQAVVTARMQRTIELMEDRQTIRSTEKDTLTGLYTREYFYRYAEQFDLRSRKTDTDAIVLDVNHFHTINERFGTPWADQVLRRIGEKIRLFVEEAGGIACRREADTFLVYCPHGISREELLETASVPLDENEPEGGRVRLRMGVYEHTDKSLDIQQRFDRAKMAADTVRNNYTRSIGVFDTALHEQERYSEQLIEDFHKAIRDGQFQVYYQPKFDIRRENNPVLASAEALVRWNHPNLGMISPGVFIPLFEENGMIQELDTFVWRETAEQIRRWKEKYSITVPVSVNVSRVDMHDPNLPDTFQSILTETGLEASNLLLEITESAYTQDSGQIISTVNHLRNLGFRVEMDDFGTGYSSLNMISNLPIDALKLDMQFIRNAFKKEDRDTRMLEVIIDIAGYLGVPVIAEGVETEEQLRVLRDLGCQMVQGYYFSRPVPAEEFEAFLEQRNVLEVAKTGLAAAVEKRGKSRGASRLKQREVRGDAHTGEKKRNQGAPLRVVNYAFVVMAVLLVIVLFVTDSMIHQRYRQTEAANERYVSAKQAAMDLEAGSDYLTESVRSFVVTGNIRYLKDYFEEAEVTKRRDGAVEALKTLLDSDESGAYESLRTALDWSNELMQREYLSMRLIQEADGIDPAQIPEAVSSLQLDPAQEKLPAVEQRRLAVELVYDEEYLAYKEKIWANVSQCTDQLIESSTTMLRESEKSMKSVLLAQSWLTLALFLAVLLLVIFIRNQVRKPLTRLVEKIQRQLPAEPIGAQELQFVTRTYNEILEENRKTHQQLTHEASHDALTGLYNRMAYEMFMGETDRENIALLLIDVDRFKTINDTYGHDVGDRILQKVAVILKNSFRSVDIICRIGGDEFIVILTRANSSMSQMVVEKIARANELLQNPDDGLPKTSVSAGAAFADRQNPRGDIFKDADTALYRMKEAGRGGCVIY